jgi:TonB family protein
VKRSQMAGMVLVALAFNVGAQTQEELAAQLKSPIATERLIALAAIEKLKKPDASLLDLVAPSLLDDSEDVRTTAAYAIAAIAGRVGCKVEALSECALLRTVFDATPKATTSVPLRYPIEARQAWVQGVVKVEFLITSDGSVSKLRVLEGPPQLRDAATSSLRQWRYQPATRNGIPVPFVMVFKASFFRS